MAAPGVIEEVHGPVIDIRCSRLPPLHRARYDCASEERYTFEVDRHRDEQRARAIGK
jgi:F-type H+-transporting ATPase subunit beta